MADNLNIAKNGSRVLSKILKKLSFSASGHSKYVLLKATWWSTGAPAVDAGSQGTYPVALGNLAYDNTNDDAYICTVIPAANTAATFVKMNA